MLEIAVFLLLTLNYVNTTPSDKDFVANFEHLFVGKIVSNFYFIFVQNQLFNLGLIIKTYIMCESSIKSYWSLGSKHLPLGNFF